MYKKRGDRSSCRSKKAQITIFMIIGVVILFAFVFIMILTSSVKKGELEAEREEIISKAFEKEALRVYVKDCLEDGLTSGLQLLGRQGGVWKEQGGLREFSEDVNGKEFDGEKIFFGITRDNYPSEENRYPCKLNDQFPEPPFCKYSYPDTGLFFGRNQLRLGTLEKDLEKYLLAETTRCIESEFLQFAQKSKLSAQGAEFSLSMMDDGINVEVHYPLRLEAGGKDFFQLSEFDFFYPTRLRPLLEVALVQPFSRDWQYIDYSYNESTLRGESFIYGSKSSVTGENCQSVGEHFLCSKPLFAEKYSSLSIDFSKTELGGGDDLFEFKPVWDEEKLQNYVLRMARQNRPPALDYISRCPAEEYDYLVVLDDEDLGAISFNFSAKDPDEDVIQLSFSSGGIDVYVNDQDVISPAQIVDDKLFVTASDGNLIDWQNVRMKLIPKLEPEVKVWNILLGDKHPLSNVLSIEDPVCLSVDTKGIQTSNGFTFNLEKKELNLTEGLNGLFSSEGRVLSSCDVSLFDVENIKENLENILYLEENSLIVRGRVPFGEEEHCGYDVNVTRDIQVRACMPLHNDLPPYIPGVSEGIPFLSNHSCCLGNIDDPDTWKLAPENQVCFQQEGCFNSSEPYFLYENVRRCGLDDSNVGVRGNICGGSLETKPKVRARNTCGKNEYPTCRLSIAEECQEQEAWGLIFEDGWCHGNSGCSYFCTLGVVDYLGISNNNDFETKLFGEQLACGCYGQQDGTKCDGNFDGVFDETCQSGVCAE